MLSTIQPQPQYSFKNTPCTLCHHASDTEAHMCSSCPLHSDDTGESCEKLNVGSGEDVFIPYY